MNEIKLELHTNAVKNFNEKGIELISDLKEIIRKPIQEEIQPFKPEVYIHQKITEKDIIGDLEEIPMTLIDQAGIHVGKYFIYKGKNIGLIYESYRKLLQLAQNIQKTKELFNMVSVSVVTDLIFSWLVQKYRHKTFFPIVEYLLIKCKEEIKDFEVWIPVALLHIQSDIKIGKITLQTITKERLEYWRSKSKEIAPDYAKNIDELFDEERKQLQGFAASTIKLTAEPKRAFEIALEKTENSISLLRFFSPANFHPEMSSHCTVLGKENMQSTTHLLIDPDGSIRFNKSVVSTARPHWIINDQEISLFRKGGLDLLSNLLLLDQRTKFQEKILESLYMYTKSSLLKDWSDKLIYILVALESILLRNDSEPIQKNVSERMAFFIGRGLNERKSIIKSVTNTYGLRSKFLHHGYMIKDLFTFEEFMMHAWKFFSQLIQNANQFKTTEEFIEAIENVKLA